MGRLSRSEERRGESAIARDREVLAGEGTGANRDASVHAHVIGGENSVAGGGGLEVGDAVQSGQACVGGDALCGGGGGAG